MAALKRIATDGTPRSVASHLGLFCLPMSTKGTPGLNELKVNPLCRLFASAESKLTYLNKQLNLFYFSV